ncbi:hypothetical protein H9657_05000 [Cellulomonas sp. Sa3CUA2]|uniref:Uncharacterized protein n=1 Tax=Cellulomonas avistercoris TaxID=2762242 RepID=A0ABR8QB18_9CELL|nr:hypothetical protein [Cellulomonas avistercoris]
MPIYHYDHMVEYSSRLAHEESNITLLCPAHHDAKSRDRLPLAKVAQANAKPHNQGAMLTGVYPLTTFYGEEFAFYLGSNHVKTRVHQGYSEGAALSVDGGPVLAARLRDNEIVVRAAIRDRDNRPVLLIRDNELRHAADGWDVTFEANRLKMWSGSRGIGMEIVFEEGALRVTRGEIFANGLLFSIRKGELIGPGASFSDCSFNSCGVSAGVSERPASALLRLGDGPRFAYEPVPSSFLR